MFTSVQFRTTHKAFGTMNIGRLLYDQNWNIGFCGLTTEELIKNKALPTVRWMKHPYRDRWFADPYILKASEEEIVVFVEECPIEAPKGILCELHIDRKSMRLKERYILLELDTHLSYPAIIEYEGKTYVYPENGASGQLNIYEYDEVKHRLINPNCILNEAVADATITKEGNRFTLIATRFPKTQKEAFLYESKSLFGPFKLVTETPFQNSLSCSRPGGNWMHVFGALYRPAQNCSEVYGGSLKFMYVDLIKNKEQIIFELKPQGFRYNKGLHTINFNNGLCVIDGCGYYYPTLARCVNAIRSFKHAIIR